MRMRIRTLMGAIALSGVLAAQAAIIPGPDAFGYTGGTLGGSFPGIADISASGTYLGQGDDTAYTATLGGAGFNFYGTVYSQLRMATNGYLSTDLSDSGPDLSNDATLPTAPSTGGGGRIYVLHDDLDVDPNNPGNPGMWHLYDSAGALFSNPKGNGVNTANIFFWNDVSHFPGSSSAATWDMQAVLFDDGNMLFLFGAGNPETGGGSTTGIMNPAYTDALFFFSNTVGTIPDDSALFIIHPDSPSAVPEPGTLALLGLALAGLAAMRRRKQ